MTLTFKPEEKNHVSGISGFALKMVAMISMLIDHTAARMYICGILDYGDLYMFLRCVGRLAFPMFCFLIVEGAVHTHNKWKYLLRLVILALISEFPFDYTLFGSFITHNWGYQNVFITLALGLCCIYVLQALNKYSWRWLAYIAVSAALAYAAENWLNTDYGAGGVLTIAVIGVLADPLTNIRKAFPYENFLRLFVMSLAICVCAYFCGFIEMISLISAGLVFFYNGQKGYSSKGLQYGFYLFYPVHLLVLGLVFGL